MKCRKVFVLLVCMLITCTISPSRAMANPLYGKQVSAREQIKEKVEKDKKFKVGEKLTVKRFCQAVNIYEDDDSVFIEPGDKLIFVRPGAGKPERSSIVSYRGNQYIVENEYLVSPFDIKKCEEFLVKNNVLQFKKCEYDPIPEVKEGLIKSLDVISIADIESDRDILQEITADFSTYKITDEGRFEDVIKYIKSKNLYYMEDPEEDNQVKTIKDGYTMCLGITRLQAYLYDRCDIEYRFVWTTAYDPENEMIALDRPSHIYLETKLDGKWVQTDLVKMLPMNKEDDTINKMYPENVGFYKNYAGLTENMPVVPMTGADTDEDYPAVYFQISPSVINGKYKGNEIINCYYPNLTADDYFESIKK